MKSCLRVILLGSCLLCQQAAAEVKEYVRDYNYHGTEFDTQSTSRINAIDGVKRELLDELGTYVGSVIRQHEDSLGNSYMSQDMVNITAGIVSLKVLNEKWAQPEYYVKAGMKADPDDVLSKLKAMRADLELEKNLRDSYEELQRARTEMAELKAQLARLRQAAVGGTTIVAAAPTAAPQPVPVPVPVSVVKTMQKKEEQAQQKAAESRQEEKILATLPAVPAAPVIASTPVVPDNDLQAKMHAEQAQKDMEKAIAEQKKIAMAASPKPVVAKTMVVAVPVAATAPAPVVKISAEEQKLMTDYQQAAQDVEVEEAFQRALAARMSGDFGALVKEIQPLAEKGYAKAQFRMGWLYERGIGVPQDFQKAMMWYEKAMANGDTSAIARVGWMYELGMGVERDYAKAARYYNEAIRAGNALGYAFLGWIYETGKGVTLDRLKARALYEKGAEMGNYLAMSRLGFTYQVGWGLDRDEKKAVELYQKCVDHGEPLSMTRLGHMYNLGQGGLEVDHKKALALLRESERYNVPASFAFLGFMYENGWAVDRDYAEARKLYEKAAGLDAPFAYFRLGVLYKDGLGVSRDREKARELLKRAAGLGVVNAGKMLERMQRGF